MSNLVALDVDPSAARPGWTAFIVIALLAIAMVLLYLSMRRQFRKINIPDSEETESRHAEPSESEPPNEAR